jgi:hypothetical protein
MAPFKKMTPGKLKLHAALAKSPVALARQTGRAIRVVLDFLLLLHQRQKKKHIIGRPHNNALFVF